MANGSEDAFIVSRIGKEGSEQRKIADEWLEEIVTPVCAELGLSTVRADHISIPGRINEQVAKYLLEAHLVIADLTGLNANVMFEVGVRHGLNLPVIPMTSDQVLPFDVADFRTIFYDANFNSKRVREAQELLKKAIPEALKGAGSSFLPRTAQPYIGLNVSGTWRVQFDKENEHRRDISIVLQQSGDLLRGVSTHVKKSEDIYGDPVRTYLQEGRIYNGFVQLNGKSPTTQRLLVNSFLLKVTRDGGEMEGAVMAYSTVEDKIFSLKCKCLKISEPPS